jgi:hypothetical protein
MASLFDRYAELIRSLPATLGSSDVQTSQFLLEQTGDLSIYYAPFDHVNLTARVAIVGITPGDQQMLLAFRAARQALLQGASNESAMEIAKRSASFGGTMRTNLVGMLDGIGLSTALGLDTSARLFEDEGWRFLHPTSAVRYPAFKRDRSGAFKNYSGSSPDLSKSALLMRYVREYLVPELRSIPDALVIPLGAAAQDALRQVAREEGIRADRFLFNFPHPSGGNAFRVRHYTKYQGELTDAVARWSTA